MSIQKIRDALEAALGAFVTLDAAHDQDRGAWSLERLHEAESLGLNAQVKIGAALALLDDLAKVDERALPSVFAALADHGIPTDVQELLLRGDGRGTVAPGAIQAAITAYLAALTETQR